MADVTPILIKDLAAQATLADTDYFIVGGADAKKITVAQMKEALGINELNTNMKHSTFHELSLNSEEYFTALGRQFCVYTESICYVHLLFELKRDLVDNNIVCQLPISDLYPLSNIGIKMDTQAQSVPFKIFNNKSIAANALIPSGGYYQLDIVIPRVR